MTFQVDHAVIDAAGRMGRHGCARTRDYFELPTMSVEDFRKRRSAGAAGTAHSNSRSALGE